MEIIDLFIEENKNKFLNNIIKIPKGYDWYFGLVLNITDFDLGKTKNIDNYITQNCNTIYEKSNKNLKLLKIGLLDDYTILIFGLNAEPFNNDIKGILKSICKYLEIKLYEVNYLKRFPDMVFNVWGEQQYKYLVSDDLAYDLKNLRKE